MKERSLSEMAVAVLGVVFGVVAWIVRLLFSVGKEIVKSVASSSTSTSQSSTTNEAAESASRLSQKAARIASKGAEKSRAALQDVQQRAGDGTEEDSTRETVETDQVATEPDVAPEEMTDGADFDAAGMAAREDITTSERRELTEQQHAEIGGIPTYDGDEPSRNNDLLTTGDTLSVSREPGVSPEGAFSYGATSFGAEIDEGADDVLSDGDEIQAEVEEAAQVHEGVVGIDVAGETDVTNPYADENEAGPDMSDDDYSELVTDADDQEPWVIDGPQALQDVPAASRGLIDDDELIDDELSTTGGEVDLVNDEADADENTGMSIVDSPDEPLAADAVSTPITDEPTLGLRDSESPNAPQNSEDDEGEGGASGEHLGISGDFEKAEEVETIPAVPLDTDEEIGTDSGDQDDEGTGSSSAAWTTASGVLETDFLQPEDAEVDNEGGTGDGDASASRLDQNSNDQSPESNEVPQGAVRGNDDGSCPADYLIKGNARSLIYHRQSDPSYEATIAEFCFATEEDAKAAGYRAPKNV